MPATSSAAGFNAFVFYLYIFSIKQRLTLVLFLLCSLVSIIFDKTNFKKKYHVTAKQS